MIRGLLVLCAVLPVVSSHVPDNLYDRLLNGYDPKVHPSKIGRKQQLGTTINFFLYHIAVTEKTTLKFNGFIRMQWIDERIGWNAADFGGLTEFSLPTEHNIWTPTVLQTDVRMSYVTVYKKPRARTNFRIFGSKTRLMRAVVTHSYQIHGEMKCITGESFPFERLQCSVYFVNGAQLEEETFKSLGSHIVLKNLFIGDTDSPNLNGWRVIDTRQQKLIYGISDETARSAIMCSVIIQRDDAALAFLVFLPFILIGTMIAGAWLTPPGVSIGICVVIAYSIMLFAEDVVQKIPSYADDDYDGITLTVIYLWVAVFLTLVFHLLLLYFPLAYRRLSSVCSRPFRTWYSFLKLESRLLNNKQDNCADDLLLEIVRLVLALLHCLLLFLFLFCL